VVTSGHWRIRLTRQAEIDYFRILETTVERFGPRQADIYEGHLIGALAALEAGPELRGSAARSDIRPISEPTTWRVWACAPVT